MRSSLVFAAFGQALTIADAYTALSQPLILEQAAQPDPVPWLCGSPRPVRYFQSQRRGKL